MVKEHTQTDKSKYCHFHKSHNHNTNDFIQVKNMIEGLFKKGRCPSTPSIISPKRNNPLRGAIVSLPNKRLPSGEQPVQEYDEEVLIYRFLIRNHN